MAAVNRQHRPRLCIIGAGVSGLAAAKQLVSYDPIVFEASGSVGGVWRNCSYRSTKLQSLRQEYEFTDFPWPVNRDDQSFPSYSEILDYLESYARHFDLLKYVQFNSKVVELRFTGEPDTNPDFGANSSLLPGRPVWEVAVQTSDSESVKVIYHFN